MPRPVRRQDADDGDARRSDTAAGDGQLEREGARAADRAPVLERRVEATRREQRREVVDSLLVRSRAEEVEDRSEPLRHFLRPARPDLDLRQAIFSSGA
jgi:hypothetical protein